MDLWIRIAGITGVAGVVLIVGLFLYDKNPILSGVIIAIGVILAIVVIVSEIYFKNKELEARIQGYLHSRILFEFSKDHGSLWARTHVLKPAFD